MLKFEFFWKMYSCIPEMYRRVLPFQISEHATGLDAAYVIHPCDLWDTRRRILSQQFHSHWPYSGIILRKFLDCTGGLSSFPFPPSPSLFSPPHSHFPPSLRSRPPSLPSPSSPSPFPPFPVPPLSPPFP